MGMLDEQDLQAIQAMLNATKNEMVAEATQNMKVIVDTQVKGWFDTLAVGHANVLVRLDRIEDKLDKLDIMVGAHDLKLRVVD